MRKPDLFAVFFLMSLCVFSFEAAIADERAIKRKAEQTRTGQVSERRVALVIGNGAYRSSPLRNPINDAWAMEKTLKGLGFEVEKKENLNWQQMNVAVSEFGEKLNHGGVGLFYYAGHGIQLNGRNYLIPVKSGIRHEKEVKYKSLDTGLVLAQMENAGNRLNIVILDACRVNPFARSFRTPSRGLAFIDSPSGTIIAYATSPGKIAEDGAGKNSLYTSELIKNMGTPGLRLIDLFNRVRKEVRTRTENTQIPCESNLLEGAFYFKPPEKPSESSTKLAKVGAELEATPSFEGKKPGDIWRDPVLGMEFVWVPGGCYQMGQTEAEKHDLIKKVGKKNYTSFYADGIPRHEVCLDGFWIGKYEVTVEQWRRFVSETGYEGEGRNVWRCSGMADPKKITQEVNHPVACVSWKEASAFASWLSRESGASIKLPFEAQWEYACRSGGKAEKYSGGDDLDEVAWYLGNSGDSTHPVGAKTANGLSIYDMSGNVWEWCEDKYSKDAYSKHQRKNPIYTGDGLYRVVRGGGWSFVPRSTRCAYRNGRRPDNRYDFIGFRLARTP